jgi:hypothetical protein
MRGLFKPILAPLRGLAAAAQRRGPAAPAAPATRRARRLGDAIDRAAASGRRDDAERLAAEAAPLAERSARLTAALARLRLEQGDPETAQRLIDGCRRPSSALRLVRAACQVLLGRRAEASLDLLRWSSQHSSPPEARLMLALLEREADETTSLQALQRNLAHAEDARTLEALVVLSVLRRRPAQTEAWAARLAAAARSGTEAQAARVMLESLGMPAPAALEAHTADEEAVLALEIIGRERAIPVLTEAQRRRPHAPTIRLLRGAIERALPDLADPGQAFHCLARLSLLLGERREAAGYAERGCAANPMSAALAILSMQLRGEAAETDAAREQAA